MSALASSGKDKYDLTREEREWVIRTVDAMGPLTDKEREALALLLDTHY